MWCFDGEGNEISTDVFPDMSTTDDHKPMSLEDIWQQLTQNEQKRNARLEELELLVRGHQMKSEERLTRLEAVVEALQSGRGTAIIPEMFAQIAEEAPLNASECHEIGVTSITVKDEAVKTEGQQGNLASDDAFYSEPAVQKTNNLKDQLLSRLRTIDKFGERENALPKHPAGGCLGILLAIGLAAFAVHLYLTYDEVPPLVTNAIKWSSAWGPFPVALRCFAQDCLVSVDVGSSTGGATGCLSKLPAAQQNKCMRLSQGESATVQTCYSFLPMNGVHVQFYGPKKWQELKPDLAEDLGADESHFGVATISDMVGMQIGMPVMEMLTPIRTGTSVAEYVLTTNETYEEGEPGAERHELFSQLISDSTHQLTNDPCAGMKASINAQGGNASGSTWQHTVLQMSPSWTLINVEKPPSFIAAAMGEVGGALELGEQAIAMLLLVVWKLQTAQENGVFHTAKSWYA